MTIRALVGANKSKHTNKQTVSNNNTVFNLAAAADVSNLFPAFHFLCIQDHSGKQTISYFPQIWGNFWPILGQCICEQNISKNTTKKWKIEIQAEGSLPTETKSLIGKGGEKPMHKDQDTVWFEEPGSQTSNYQANGQPVAGSVWHEHHQEVCHIGSYYTWSYDS